MVYKSIIEGICLATIYIQFITSIVHCHKHGAPNKSCKTLLPHHKHITYHETSAEIKTFIIDGNNIDIEIQSEKPFKGKYDFLLHNQPLLNFLLTLSEPYHIL